MQILDSVKKYKKTLIITALMIMSMPLIEVLIKIIFTYGTYIGTFIRNISESGACL